MELCASLLVSADRFTNSAARILDWVVCIGVCIIDDQAGNREGERSLKSGSWDRMGESVRCVWLMNYMNLSYFLSSFSYIRFDLQDKDDCCR